MTGRKITVGNSGKGETEKDIGKGEKEREERATG